MNNIEKTEQSEIIGKLDKIYISTEKTRKYFMWALIISLAVVVLPFVALLFMIPKYLDVLNSGLGGL